ncbi:MULTISPECIES: multidrug effflux MFS transporter [unclassified Beijerinckia]|uniref:multidrug effflux MFS transporter n=1 Tax=unclassified Beijerinckia TaxID=2638183 RepID=UPI000895438E|nr:MULTISPECIES: multidrug effflux MFS transporter [unclassified Beijerinckia]MDH7794091.1 DHA1 family bicyclomycin/chloramphenicol resistance-like MFS transporter [Beijerinckia sp. GAS462]SEB53119.1 MFS transporter, DHA1 family, bicyclomycin/chloramphenicol resistance protein [Beijerinckia sp. 28-YEA-48]
MRTSFARNALTLGLLSAIGPFAIDMYLPALPALGADLKASTFGVQMTLMAYFVGFGLTQIIYGPLSDIFGRKLPLYFGLGLFALATLGAAMATSIEWLIALRVIQGVGAAAAMVIPRAVIRDLHTGVAAARLMSLVMLVFSVSPILAPLFGSALIVPFGWRAVFYAVAVTALIGLALVAFSLPETRPPATRMKGGLKPVLSSYGYLLRDWHFMSLSIIGGLGISSFMVFLSTSAFIYMDHFGLTPTLYSLAFSINAVGFIGASQLSASLGQRFGMGRVVLGAVSAFAVMAVAHLLLALSGIDNIAVVIPMLFMTFTFLGLVIPASMVMSLDPHGPIAGMASALGGTLQMVIAAVVIVLASLSFNGTVLAMVAAIALCAIGTVILAWMSLGTRMVAAPAE